MLIVDMDLDGKLTDNDLVDDIRSDSGNGRFSVLD